MIFEKKKRELTDQQKAFLDAMFGEAQGDPKTAAETAGYAPNSYPTVVFNLKDEIVERAEHVLAMYAARAAHKLGRSLDEGATEPGANIRLQAAEKILDRVGLSKKERLEISGAQGSPLFILPAKNVKNDEADTA